MRLEYFLLVDRVISHDLVARTICCEATVPTKSTVFEGHFPGFPLMPGVLLIETMAQASGWLLVAANKFQRMPFLAAVKEAKLRTFVMPGQRLTVDAKVTHDGSGYAMTDASISCDSKVVSNATITFRVVRFPNPDFAAEMRRRAVTVGLLSSEALADG
jgi:3-hydroxyacyl-[acyl-carrier-protein] dehydratase